MSDGVPAAAAADRRRVDRRSSERIADLSLPEFRRIVVTTLIASAVAAAFLWMVRTVIVAGILGAVIAAYLRPLYEWLRRRTGRPALAALLALTVVAVPVLATLAYSYLEIVRVAQYLALHQEDVSARIDAALQRLVFMQGASSRESARTYVLAASDYGAKVPSIVRHALSHFSVATTIFLFTAFYVFTKGEQVSAYLRAQVPPRYAEFVGALERNLRAVLYGAVYATFVTQLLKSAVILAMNLAFDVPLAGVLAAAAFVIGFFPIVGSWSVYLPVALWLLVFRDAPVRAGLMIAIGTLLNTLFISMYLRPKLAADRSRVLDFYWMFVGLITGVYTFGLAGIILGPILIGLLKAVVDTVTAQTSWSLLDADGAVVEAGVVIRFTHVTMRYPRTGTALQRVTFHIAKGEFAFLTGPSGAGKSTILRLIYMADRPTEGEVKVSGVSSETIRAREIPKLRRKLGVVFQDFRLLEDRTVEANVAFALEVTGHSADAIPGKVSKLLTQVGLASKATAYPKELSGGEQQRVAIARALVNDPIVLVADEPTGNLDDRATRGVFQLLREINASGTAVVMATHNLDLIRRSDYRTIEVNRGQIVFDSKERILTPASVFAVAPRRDRAPGEGS